jgi:hypothetical protein
LSGRSPARVLLRGTTALGTVLCSVGAVFLLLAALVGSTLLSRPEILTGEPALLVGVMLHIISRVLVVTTGVATLRRARQTAILAAIGLGVTVLAGVGDSVLYAADPTARGRFVLTGSLTVLTVVAGLFLATLLYLKRPKVRDEFDRGAPVPMAGA